MLARVKWFAVVVFLSAVAGAPSAAVGEAPEEDFGKCRSLVEDGKWKAALAAYRKLFADHEGAAVLLDRRRDVEEDLKLCRFRLIWKEPSPDELFGEGLRRFSASSRKIELAYPDGPDGEPWSETRPGRVLRIRFEKGLRISLKTTITYHIVVFLCLTPGKEGGYAVTLDAEPRIVRFEGEEETTLDGTTGREFAKYYEVEIEREGSKIKARYYGLWKKARSRTRTPGSASSRATGPTPGASSP